jgi:outer membrane protein assembly factor BamB
MQWHYETENRIDSSPVIADGILYIGSMDGYFYALNARNGRRLLKFKAYSSIISSPAILDGVAYVGTSKGLLYAVEGGARNWLFENKLTGYWKALYLYGDLPKPPPASGYLWSRRLGGSILSSPAVDGERLYIGAGSQLVAVDISKHEVLWRFETGGWVESSPAVYGDSIYFGSSDTFLYALNAASGSLLWKIQTKDKITSSPVVAGGIIFVGSHDGNMYAIH